MQAHHAGGQGEAEPEAGLAAAGVEPDETVEHAPAIGFRNARSVIRDGELDRFAARLHDLTPKQREAVEALVQGIIGKMLYRPTVRLKDAAGSARGERLADALRDLFDL